MVRGTVTGIVIATAGTLVRKCAELHVVLTETPAPVRNRRTDHWEPEERRLNDVSTAVVARYRASSAHNSPSSVAGGLARARVLVLGSVPRRLVDALAALVLAPNPALAREPARAAATAVLPTLSHGR